MLECSVLCLSGGTGAVNVQPNIQQCSSVVGVSVASCPLFVALMGHSRSCAILSVMSGNGIAIRRSAHGVKLCFLYVGHLKSEEQALEH